MNKKIIWSLIGVVTLASCWSFYYYFEKAFPFVHVSITMDADQAKKSALDLAEYNSWNLQDYNCAVQFSNDETLQSFVELEGGGKQAYIDMLEKKYYMPYQWQVRFFKEKEIHEVIVCFAPDGSKISFKQILSQDEPGNNLSESAAREVAQQAAADWNYDVTVYHLVEHSEIMQKGKRLDHTFTYERSDISLGKGLYRLMITVAGDKVVQVRSSVKIPDEFNRRYAHMSSANHLIATIAKGVSIFLYLFIFGLFGLFVLYRKRYLVISENITLFVIAIVLGVVVCINWIPQIWNHYVTTISQSVFIMQLCLSSIVSILIISSLLVIISLIGSSFDRYVFGKHIQIFKSWSQGVAGTYSIAEQTLLGYCCAAMLLGYLVIFYTIATLWGWWFPLQQIFDPNVLSLYVPALSSNIIAFATGFWEEMAFRVVPIAGILLILRNSRYKHAGLLIMFMVQTLLFAAAHASYPQQPAYFRIVEMFIPFTFVGYMYYAVGFLPCFIMHAVYDAILFCIPIFTSGLLFQKILAIFLIGVPLWIVLIRWIQQGYRFVTVPLISYNHAWQPKQQDVVLRRSDRLLGASIPYFIKKYAYVFGIVGIVLATFFSKEFEFDTPPIIVTEKIAKDVAQKAISEQFGDIGNDWNVFARFDTGVLAEGNKFIWQEYGNMLYQQLQGSYVIPPHYSIKLVKFVGSVEQRAEEYRALISPDGTVLSLRHILPEGQSGADILEHRAKDIAYQFVRDAYDLQVDDVEFVSCSTIKHEFRRDWTVVLKDIKNYAQPQGQAHILIEIAGDKVAHYERYIDVPEKWSRLEREQSTHKRLFSQVCLWGFLLLLFLFMAISFKAIEFNRSLLKICGVVGVVLLLVSIMNFINDFEQVLYGLNSAQPFFNQMQMIIMMTLVFAVEKNFGKAILCMSVFLMARKGLLKEFNSLIMTAFALGCGIVGLFSFVGCIEPAMHAYAPMYNFLNGHYSLIATLIFVVTNILGCFSYLVAVWTVAQYSNRFYKSRALELFIFIVSGICFFGMHGDFSQIWACLILGVMWGVVWYVLYYYVYQYNIELLLLTVATIQCLLLVPSAWYGAYPTILIDVVLTIVIILAGVVFGCKKLQAG